MQRYNKYKTDLKGPLCYANDTIIYSAASEAAFAIQQNQDIIIEVCNWCFLNRLSINTKKTKHMLVMSRKDENVAVDVQLHVYMDNIKLENVHNYNYLGVKVDDKLSFTEFTDNKYNKVNMRLYHLKRLRPYINNEIANRIYKQTILPLMDYSDFMIESSSQPQIRCLEKLQEKAVKYIDNNMYGDMKYEDLCDLYSLQPVKLRWREHILCLMYRQSKMCRLIDTTKAYIDLRSNHSIKFKKPRKRTYELYLKSPMYRCAKLWDMLKPEVQKATTKVKFKSFIKQMCRP